MIRIASGSLKWKVIKFKSINRSNPRPTQGLVKKGLFSIISHSLTNTFFLDLFAGSGSVGFEAYSNGAEKIYFVEKEKLLIDSLKKNLITLKVLGEVFAGSYEKALEFYGRKKISFNFIYVDPPYEIYHEQDPITKKYLYEKILNKIEEARVLKEGGMIVVERNKKVELPAEEVISSMPFSFIQSKTYGNSALDFYKTD